MMPFAPLRAFLSSRLLGQRLGQMKNAKIPRHYLNPNVQKKFLISDEIRNFLVETAGLEPVTSCV